MAVRFHGTSRSFRPTVCMVIRLVCGGRVVTGGWGVGQEEKEEEEKEIGREGACERFDDVSG